MRLVVVTDIFGQTAHFLSLVNQISSKFCSVEIVDPYDGEEVQFKSEEDAYHCFQEKMGLDHYSNRVFCTLQNYDDEDRIVVIGFSVGASAIWAISGELDTSSNMQGICFYSSQIRKYLDLNPNITIDLYFAQNEPSYDVGKISEIVSGKTNVTCYETSYLHGFMNDQSSNFSQLGYEKYLEIIERKIQTFESDFLP